jgi:hypothetical protein
LEERIKNLDEENRMINDEMAETERRALLVILFYINLYYIILIERRYISNRK